MTPRRTSASTARAAYDSRGVATTTSMKPSSARSLRWAGARWIGLWPWKKSRCPCPAPISSLLSAGSRRRSSQKRPVLRTSITSDADDTGEAAADAGVVDAAVW